MVDWMDPLIRNLDRYARLSREDRTAIGMLADAPRLQVKARGELIREGDQSDVVRLMVSGWACRFKDLPDGRRQIIGFFIPGDFCDLHIHILREMDHSIGALTDVNYLAIPPKQLQAVMDAQPRIAQSLLWHELVNSAIQREWMLNLGQRTSLERLAHLLVEIFMRLEVVGLTRGKSCDFPLTQSDMADATGVTAVHLNRTLQELRRDGLVALKGKRLTIGNMETLKQVAMFNENYLHLDHEGRHLDADD